ncbi:MAG: nicotinate dehydrogenase subunit A [Paracoccaceae bacterium]|jgi:nicotinate dehydrogenase subunit A
MDSLTLTINGQTRDIDCDPATPLLYVLRNDLDLTGAKLGCGLEQCGACAVLVDGEATLCCNRPAGEFTGKDIVTIEALGNDVVGAAVQKAFIAEGAAQCGYCTAGLVVAATSLLKANTTPDRDAIVAGLEEHLCRCGSHGRVIAAIERAAKEIGNV